MISETRQDNLAIARSYLKAIEDGAPFDALSQFFAPDCIQEEFPNRFTPNGARRTVEDLRLAAARGRKAVEAERYEILNEVAQGDHVALEVQWSARLQVPFGMLQPGDTMRARFAFFLTFRDGLIFRQHNYDCFDPF
ncbi:MAG TPA: nuclear transport factor 2 family protein [Thermoanaerobaculia bacterium]|nr:nuclear transport factor 2 family protein [Thermoanaerobaculia bacterium]